ncbi:CRISPR-associated endonuclease Cas2 [Saccharospirillum salsuginis]|uniref:CRISPR-associated endoribonuclease Cas2 n=1 Tax=Saccharospirillum salsuginis TaxID=418750 RepID=A0A918N9M3_9GAMM|nr:CRISPR-associated endonuclease Cas2 [Saccharospirillum salsuginis]GGX56634.1 CRISPR-associated endoribonuclease Cas2 [Saccharospirillum salsuginis]
MLVLVTYDVSVTTSEGRRRLRTIAKICLDYGMRVQNSVFECDVDPAQFAVLKEELISTYDSNEDSLRFYFLGKKGRQRVEHYGSKPVSDPTSDPLIV